MSRPATLLCLMSLTALAEGRLALVVGQNRGLASEETLRFAQKDAVRVARTLVDVGGFAAGDVTTLTEADADGLRAALATLRARLGQGPHERLLIYVSSHAGEGALHLKGTTFALRELLEFLKAAPVRVGLLIVDSCQSGQVTQVKGLKALDVPLMRLEASALQGRVLISASGANEYAQESDALQGSYFTHHFTTGLRGAADSSQDGKVSLEEAYSWAWARTVEATFSSNAGVQRPAFSVDLRGTGQLILAEPEASASRLILDVKAPGHWLLVSADNGEVVADLDKPEGPRSLALPPGSYRVRLRAGNRTWEKLALVPASGAVSIGGQELEELVSPTVSRKGTDDRWWVASASGSATSGLVRGLAVEPGLELRLRYDGAASGPLNQWTTAVAWRLGQPASQGFQHTEVEVRLGVAHRFVWPRASVALGLEMGPLLVHQWALPDASQRTSLGLSAVLGAEARVGLTEGLEAVLLGTGGGGVTKKLEGSAFIPRASASLGLAFRF